MKYLLIRLTQLPRNNFKRAYLLNKAHQKYLQISYYNKSTLIKGRFLSLQRAEGFGQMCLKLKVRFNNKLVRYLMRTQLRKSNGRNVLERSSAIYHKNRQD